MTDSDDPLWAQLQVLETCHADGILHIALVGELDLAVANRLSTRLDQLSRGDRRVYVDLSQLEFVDLSGVRVLAQAAGHSCQHGEQAFEIGHETKRIVRRVIELAGAARILWPANHASE